MTDLWLVRHGQTDWNVEGRWQGQTERAPGLNAVGRAQALAVRGQLKEARFSAIYSSDLLRSQQTAEWLAEPLGLDVALEPRLREMDLGAWEGMLSSDIENQYPRELEERKQDPFHARTPNGESPLEVAERALAAMDEIAAKHPGGSVLMHYRKSHYCLPVYLCGNLPAYHQIWNGQASVRLISPYLGISYQIFKEPKSEFCGIAF